MDFAIKLKCVNVQPLKSTLFTFVMIFVLFSRFYHIFLIRKSKHKTYLTNIKYEYGGPYE